MENMLQLNEAHHGLFCLLTNPIKNQALALIYSTGTTLLSKPCKSFMVECVKYFRKVLQQHRLIWPVENSWTQCFIHSLTFSQLKQPRVLSPLIDVQLRLVGKIYILLFVEPQVQPTNVSANIFSELPALMRRVNEETKSASKPGLKKAASW